MKDACEQKIDPWFISVRDKRPDHMTIESSSWCCLCFTQLIDLLISIHSETFTRMLKTPKHTRTGSHLTQVLVHSLPRSITGHWALKETHLLWHWIRTICWSLKSQSPRTQPPRKTHPSHYGSMHPSTKTKQISVWELPCHPPSCQIRGNQQCMLHRLYT